MAIEARTDADTLVHQLQFANACWDGQRQVCHCDVVRAVFYLFRDWRTAYWKFPEQRIIEALKGQSLQAFVKGINEASFHRSSSNEGRGITLARILAEFYNTHSHGHKLWHVSSLELPAPPPSKKDA